MEQSWVDLRINSEINLYIVLKVLSSTYVPKKQFFSFDFYISNDSDLSSGPLYSILLLSMITIDFQYVRMSY